MNKEKKMKKKMMKKKKKQKQKQKKMKDKKKKKTKKKKKDKKKEKKEKRKKKCSPSTSVTCGRHIQVRRDNLPQTVAEKKEETLQNKRELHGKKIGKNAERDTCALVA